MSSVPLSQTHGHQVIIVQVETSAKSVAMTLAVLAVHPETMAGVEKVPMLQVQAL